MSLLDEILTSYLPVGTDVNMYEFIKKFNPGFSIAYVYKRVFDRNNKQMLFSGSSTHNIDAVYDGYNMDVINYNILFNEGYITINEYGNHIYYHIPEPKYNEVVYDKNQLDYLNKYDITMSDLADEQHQLYNIARELDERYKHLLFEGNDVNIQEINYSPSSSTLVVYGLFPDPHVFDNASIGDFRSLVAHLYHGNTLHDVTRITEPLRCFKCYSLLA